MPTTYADRTQRRSRHRDRQVTKATCPQDVVASLQPYNKLAADCLSGMLILATYAAGQNEIGFKTVGCSRSACQGNFGSGRSKKAK